MKKEEKLREGLNRLLSEPTDPTRAERVLNKLTGGPSPEFRISVEETSRTIWDDSVGVGLRFEKGERLSRYLLTFIVPQDLLTREDGTRILDEVRHRLLNFAIEIFPEEFRTEVR